MIKFIESNSSSYVPRTLLNAQSDITFAFAIDFSTRGEMLTKSSVRRFKKKYIPISLLNLSVDDERCAKICAEIPNGSKAINIAGNGIYSLPQPQEIYDEFIFNIMETLFYMSGCEWTTIVTGGQTGIDESGLKFGDKKGFETICRFPMGYRMRLKDNTESWSKSAFLNRFK